MNRFGLALWRLAWPLRARWKKGLDKGGCFADFSLKDVSGVRYTLSDNPSCKFTALWFTNFCEDCRSKIPLLEDLRRAGGDRFRVLAVSLLGDDLEPPRQAAAVCGFPILLDPRDVTARELGLSHPPGTCPLHNFFVLAPDRRVLFRHHLSAVKPDALRLLWASLGSKPVDR